MIIKELVKKIFEQADSYEWQVQGLGMLRMYLTNKYQLHIWNPKLCYADNSVIHTHPWSFKSIVLCGKLTNYIYKESETGEKMWRQRIHCGEGGGLVGDAEIVHLEEERKYPVFPVYKDTLLHGYQQNYSYIHRTEFVPGTVSLIERHFEENTEVASVYWPHGTGWTSAEPREAKRAEIIETLALAFSLFEKEEKSENLSRK